MLEEENCQLWILYLAKISFKKEAEIKTESENSDEGKTKRIFTYSKRMAKVGALSRKEIIFKTLGTTGRKKEQWKK